MANIRGKRAMGGALQGAGAGATIGSAIMPGWGTAIGALGGALVGGIGGYEMSADEQEAEDARVAAEKRRQANLERVAQMYRDQQAKEGRLSANVFQDQLAMTGPLQQIMQQRYGRAVPAPSAGAFGINQGPGSIPGTYPRKF